MLVHTTRSPKRLTLIRTMLVFWVVEMRSHTIRIGYSRNLVEALTTRGMEGTEQGTLNDTGYNGLFYYLGVALGVLCVCVWEARRRALPLSLFLASLLDWLATQHHHPCSLQTQSVSPSLLPPVALSLPIHAPLYLYHHHHKLYLTESIQPTLHSL